MTSLTRRNFLLFISAIGIGLPCSKSITAYSKNSNRFDEYVEAVTSGKGYLPWQERGISEAESVFREHIETRKARIIDKATKNRSSSFFTGNDFDQLKRIIASSPMGEKWFSELKKKADYLISRPSGYVVKMIPELTPTNGYGWTCPNCVGKLSQEGHGRYDWNFKNPDILSCRTCGQIYPSDRYPETALLVCPRRNQAFTFYLNQAERLNPLDRSGKFAYKWAHNRPIHISFSGLIRHCKIAFMITAAKDLALIYRITSDDRYAVMAGEILIRLAHCYPNWLYHDYRDTFADCDPIFAAWYDKKLPLVFKRHLCTVAYSKDSFESAAMLQTYWGAGRIWPSTDAIPRLAQITMAYELIRDCINGNGTPIWDKSSRFQVESNLIIEYLISSEPFLGGPGKADNWSNKAPRVYYAMAVVGGALHIPEFVQTALDGYVKTLRHAFLPDGFSRQSPGYTQMYLVNLSRVAVILEKARFLVEGKNPELNIANESLQLAFRCIRDQLRPDGSFFPLADTQIGKKPAAFKGENINKTLQLLLGNDILLEQTPFHSSGENTGAQKNDIYFPFWMTSILRHQGKGKNGALAFTFSPHGPHRHRDNLSLFYEDGGAIVLGDHGYFGDSPVNRWIKSSFSHNLVIVDNQEQKFADRKPILHRMLTSPNVSVVEASSKVYDQCSMYKRLIMFFKGPNGASFVVDFFRVKGGKTHDYRIFSEIASSDDEKGGMTFFGLGVPSVGPLHKVGADLSEDKIFRLRDSLSDKTPPDTWQAIWQGGFRSYKLWFLSSVDEVVVSNGPGQENKLQIGRRVRYLDAIRRGKELESTFIAIHEPLQGPDSSMIEAVETLKSPDNNIGDPALALRIQTKLGSFFILNNFEQETEVQDIRFKGKLAIVYKTAKGADWFLSSEAELLKCGSMGFSNQSPVWSGAVSNYTSDCIKTVSKKPENWDTIPSGCQNHVLVLDGGYQTGYPVSEFKDTEIKLDRFPLNKADYFSLPSFNYSFSLTGQAE